MDRIVALLGAGMPAPLLIGFLLLTVPAAPIRRRGTERKSRSLATCGFFEATSSSGSSSPSPSRVLCVSASSAGGGAILAYERAPNVASNVISWLFVDGRLRVERQGRSTEPPWRCYLPQVA